MEKLPSQHLFSFPSCAAAQGLGALAPAPKIGPETCMSNVGCQWFLMFLLVTNLETQVWGNQHKAFNLMTGNELFKKKKADFLTLSLEPFAYVILTYWSPDMLAFWLFLEHSEYLCITGCTLCLEWSSLLSVANSLTSFKPCLNANLPAIPTDLRLQPTFSLVPISWPQFFSPPHSILNILCNVIIFWIYS